MASSGVSGYSFSLTIEGDALGGSRNFTLNLGQGVIDTTARDSSQWRELLAGTREWSIDFDGLYVYNDLAKKYLLNHWSTQTPATLTIVLTDANSVTYTGECYIESLTVTAPYEDAAAFSGTLRGTSSLALSAS